MNSIVCWNHVFHQENSLTHVLVPPAKNIPKQNLRNGTLLWLSRTHSQTHLSGDRSSSDGAENCRKLHSKTNRTVTNACKAPEIPIPVTRPQRIKCQERVTTNQGPPDQVGAAHVAPVFPRSQQWKPPPGRPATGLKKFHLQHIHSTEVYIPRTRTPPAGTWFLQRLPRNNRVQDLALSAVMR